MRAICHVFLYAKRVVPFYIFIIVPKSFFISVISYDDIFQIHYSKLDIYITYLVYFQSTAINVDSWKSFFICFARYTPDSSMVQFIDRPGVLNGFMTVCKQFLK